jgi:TetR/AcrR family transcriptional regulator, regulator of cefoperazone and chloramphenicol sensitivity
MAIETQTLNSLNEDTCKSLLYTAGEVFAEYGFRAATVREICRRANVNIASINYHFGSKEELYAQVLEHSFRTAAAEYPYDDRTGPPEKRLEEFITNFMHGCLRCGQAAWHGKLMAREMVDPTGVLPRIVERAIRPRKKILTGIITEILGEGFTDKEIEQCVFSIIGQCVFYNHARPVINVLSPSVKYDEAWITRTAEHITDFSLAALRLMARRKRR